ncbi:hypothetical protein DFQ29_005461 [Apophysomyces sp. BC1021]|nr:hypothetical protein DFQ29_005461 [Apophysomyces sp. BC1021]
MDYGYNSNQQQDFSTADTSKTVVNDKTAECEIDLIKDSHKNLTEMLEPKPGTTSPFNEMKTSEPRWERQRNRSHPIEELDNMHNRQLKKMRPIDSMKRYIQDNYKDLDIIKLYQRFCCGKTRKLFKLSVKTAVESLFNGSNDQSAKNWCQSMIDNDYPFCQDGKSMMYWNLRLEGAMELKKQSTITSMKNSILDSLITSTAESSTSNKEQDKMLFGNASHGAIKLNNCENLTKKEKYTMGLCLNSILNLADETEDSQKQLFSDGRWNLLKAKHMKSKAFHLYYYFHISDLILFTPIAG